MSLRRNMAKQTAETLNLITKWTKNCELVIPWPIPDLLNKVLLILCYSGVKNKLAKTEISFEKRTGCLQGKAKGTLETQNTFMIQHEQKKVPSWCVTRSQYVWQLFSRALIESPKGCRKWDHSGMYPGWCGFHLVCPAVPLQHNVLLWSFPFR